MWFGPPDGLAPESRLSAVVANTGRMFTAFWGTDQPLSNHWVARCTNCTEGYAYVNAAVPWTINLCPTYFSDLQRFDWFGGLSQPGALIHEMSHFAVVANTLDRAANYDGARRLADTNPWAAANNADNYSNFFSNQDNLPPVR